MSYKTYPPPPSYKNCSSYDHYKALLEAWSSITDVPKEKQAVVVGLSLEGHHETNICEKIFASIPLVDLKKDTGLTTLIAYLDSELGKDDLEDVVARYDEFEDYKKQAGESIVQYISNFQQKVTRISAKNIKLPSEVLGFKLLRGAGLSKEEKILVLSGIDYEKRNTLYEQTQKSLKKFKGEGTSGGCHSSSSNSNTLGASGPSIKLEPTFYTRQSGGRGFRGMDRQTRGMIRPSFSRGYNSMNPRAYTRGYNPGGNAGYSRGYNPGGNAAYSRGYNPGLFRPYGNREGPNSGSWRARAGTDSYRHRRGPGERHMNPIGIDGQPLRCDSCDSYRHFVYDCPHSWENASVKKVNVVEDHLQMGGDDAYQYGPSTEGEIPDEYGNLCDDMDYLYRDPYAHSSEEPNNHPENVNHTVVLFTGNRKDEILQLQDEASQAAVLDCACTSTVCGSPWMNEYLESLNEDDRKSVVIKPGKKVFKFGIGLADSMGVYTIPTYIVGERVFVTTDVTETDVPLLFSAKAMQDLGIAIDFVTDVGRVLGKIVQLNRTSSGHYCLPLNQSGDVEFVNVVDLLKTKVGDLKMTLKHLHRQMGHPAKNKLVSLIKDSVAWKDEYDDVLKDIHQNCNRCKELARTPSSPVVALPMASTFNEKVAMDLKKWNERWILHMVDMFSRYTISVFVSRKTSTTILSAVINFWICYFGIMQGIFSDNGGEFRNDEIREVASVLNFELASTAADSPFQNGLCEKNHAIVDLILTKLVADYPRISVDILLRWANMAKNSLQMWSGFSSNQLVLGFNPRLPSIMCDPLPSMNETTLSDALATHLNILHDARKAFIQSESEERIKRALRYRVRSSETVYVRGDRVLYKREGKQQWLGPARVVFQDRKVVLLDHGGYFIKVSPNRLVKCSDSFKQSGDSSDQNVRKNISENSDGYQGLMFEDVGDDHEIHDVDLPEINDHDVNSDIQDNEHNDIQDNEHIQPEGDDTFVETNRRSLRVMNKELGSQVYIVSIPNSLQNSQECNDAKEVELKKLVDFGVYDVIDDRGQSCISTRWVLWQKGDGVRARLVARGFEEDLLEQVDSPTVGKCTMRMLLVISSSRGWQVKSLDIKSAFLQGEKLERVVLLRPPKEAKVPGKLWHLKRCLYGLSDAARKFYESVVFELMSTGCVRLQLDPSVFAFTVNNQLLGIIITHIDDFLYAGTDEFYIQVVSRLCKRFQIGSMSQGSFRYVGYQIHQTECGIFLDQCEYAENIPINRFLSNREFQKHDELTREEKTEYRSLVGSLNWMVQGTRPDLAFTLIDLSTKFQKGTVSDLIQAKKVVLKAKTDQTVIHYPSLGNEKSWSLVVWTDASHANLCEGTGSGMGYVLFAVNSAGDSCPIVWKANKIDRVVRSTIAAEILACVEGIEEAIYIKQIFIQILSLSKADIPIIAFVDHQGAVDAIHSTKLVKDRRLRIDVAALKECLEKGHVADIRHCASGEQLADCLTKKGVSGDKLRAVFQSGSMGFVASM